VKREIETGDLFRGAYLLCSGGCLEEARMTRRREVLFLISGEDVRELDIRYRTGQALVNPLQLRETLNLLRDIVFEKLRSGERRTHHGSVTG